MANEVHVINVSPKDENHTIRVFQTFGWKRVGNQTVYSRDSHLERRGNSIYNVTKTTNFVKLTFERDASTVKNYAQLRRLEKEYYSVAIPKKPSLVQNAILWTLGLSGIVFLLFAMLLDACSSTEAAFAFRVIGILFIGIAVYLYFDYKKKMDNWKKANADCWNRREEILRQAQAYQ